MDQLPEALTQARTVQSLDFATNLEGSKLSLTMAKREPAG